VIHGELDTLVPVEDARRFVGELKRTSRAPVVYAEIPGAQHAFEIFPSLRALSVVHGIERFLAYLVSEHKRTRAMARPAAAASAGPILTPPAPLGPPALA
jgi:acetyl esterase/lipase